MGLSALDFDITFHETSFLADLLVASDDRSAFGYPPSGLPVVWGISGCNITTQEPVDDSLNKVNWYFAHKYFRDNVRAENTVLTTIEVAPKSFYMDLYPPISYPNVQDPIHLTNILPITPFLSGGTSVQIYVTAQPTSPNVLGDRINISNYAEGGRVIYLTPKGEITNNPIGNTALVYSSPASGILSGYWVQSTANSGFEVSGSIDYSNGHVWVDFSHIPDQTFEVGFSTVYVKYEGNYLPETILPIYHPDIYFTTSALAISGARLYFNVLTGDTDSYYISCWSVTNTEVTGGHSFVFHPKSMAILETNYNFTTAALSAVHKQRNSYQRLAVDNVGAQNWPFDSTYGRAMIWKSSSPLLTLSARSVQSTSMLSGWSTDIENINIFSTYPLATTFQVTAYFPDDYYSRRTSAVYTFNYEPVATEDLKITTLNQTLTTEYLKVYRQVVLSSGNISYVSPLRPLTWTLLTPTLYSTITSCSGLVPDDLTDEKYYQCQNGVGFSQDVGLITAVPLYSSMGVLTGYDNVYGVDYLKVKYDPNPDVVYQFKVAYQNDPSILDVHTFQVYSSANNIAISALAFDNQPFTRSLTAKAMKDKGGGIYAPLHPLNKIIWNIAQPVAGSVTARKLDGSIYDYTSYSEDTIVLEIETPTFDLVNTFPALWNYTLYASAFNTYNNPTLFSASTSFNFNVDTFPATSLFDSYLKVNNESSKLVTDMWRASTVVYVASTYDMTTIVGTNVVTGTRLIDFGNGTTSSDSYASSPYNNLGVYPITLKRSDVSAAGWLSAHSIESTIDLHLINRFLSADFLVYPTYVFLTSAIQTINNLTSPITSRGVSAYDVNHTEPFILSAFESNVPTYYWTVADATLAVNSLTAIYNRSAITPTSGLTVALRLYNNDLPLGMPQTYLDDNNGSVKTYPNFKQTADDGNPIFSNIKVVDYDRPTTIINSYTSELFLPVNNRITATNIVIYPTDIPVVEGSSLTYWALSTPNWSLNYNNALFDFSLTLGVDDTVIGTIKFGATYPLVLILNRKTYSNIPNTFPPYDWGMRQVTDMTSVVISYSAVPELLFVPAQKYNLLNQSVIFLNATEQTPLVSAFYVNDGYHASNIFLSGFDNFVTSYPIVGTFNLYVTGVLFDGNTYTSMLPNIVTIVSAYEAFDPNVTRVFGATVLTLPRPLDEVKIPPNEWATAYNFNRSINLLNNNLDYLRNMTKFYSLPPIDYIGWLGSTSSGITTSFHWNYNDLTNYVDLSASVANHALSSVSDMVYKNNTFYVADTNEVKIFNTSFVPTTLNTISMKTVDDPIIQAKSIGVDSTDRIYVLDKPKNRVLVFGPYLAGDPNSNKFLFEWGGLGGAKARMKFNTPNDMIVDHTNSIWVSDTGNKAVKQYTRTGSWLQTIDLNNYVTGTTPESEGIISVAFDSEQNIHILTKSQVFKFSNTGTYLTSYTFRNTNNEQPQKIIAMDGGGFLYICLQTSIIKLQENGSFAGEFANDIADANYTSIYHDVFKNFYIANGKNILKYYESNIINSSAETSVDRYIWSQADINVDKDENIQDWVCNIILKRFWDNVELFRRSLTGAVEYTTNSKGLPEILIRNFTPQEYAEMYLVDKDDVFVGVNEFVTADVLNRCITQIHNSMENIKLHI